MQISWTLLLLVDAVMIQYTDCLPQFSTPFVSWNKNKEEPSQFLNIRIQNPISSFFGKNRQVEKTRGNDEVIKKNENLITVTPKPGYYTRNYDKLPTVVTQTTQDPRIWGIHVEENGDKNVTKEKQNLENKKAIKKNQDKHVGDFNLKGEDVNSISTDNDATTESTTEYESTTFDDLSDFNRSGVSGHVVATLLG